MPSPDRVRTAVAALLRNDKALTEREVKAAMMKRLGRQPINARVIRQVRRKLGIDRPRAIAWARHLLVKTPRLEAKGVIAEVRERFGIHLSPPDVTRLRPARERRTRAPKGGSSAPPAKIRHEGTVTITYHANGDPDDVALFFRTLAE